jgi:uncharacterized protein YjbI with pentapeptide repeats
MQLDAEVDFSDLTLPRTFFGRSELDGTAFRNTDLTESNLCWNDFNGVGADLRRSSFTGCIFEGALLKGAGMPKGKNCRCHKRNEQ